MGSHPVLSCQGIAAERPQSPWLQRLWVLVHVWRFLGTCKGLAKCLIPADSFRSWRSVCVLWDSKPFPTCCAWMHRVPWSLTVQWVRAWMPQLLLPFHAWSLYRGNLRREEGREGAAAFTSQSANWAGRAEHPLCDYTALHCSPCLRPALINTSGTNKNTEMREKIQPLLLANFCVSCWEVF